LIAATTDACAAGCRADAVWHAALNIAMATIAAMRIAVIKALVGSPARYRPRDATSVTATVPPRSDAALYAII
jgi:hypothetical protein